MFFQFSDTISEVQFEDIDKDRICVGFVSVDELAACSYALNFSEDTIQACRTPTKYFRSGVELHDKYTFTELRIVDIYENNEDCVALYIKKNMLLVVDVFDKDGSTKKKFMAAINRYSPENVTLEKLVFSFFDVLVCADIKALEDIGHDLSALEETMYNDEMDKAFNAVLFEKKKLLSRLHNYYEQILDITESIDENENDIFDYDNLIYINNITKRVKRLREDADSLKNGVEHLQSAYSSHLDAKLNTTMKIFTVMTSIFFPLTVIVGWYGMNFETMPEFSWRYGYLYVILLSVVIDGALILIAKKKKWF